MVYKKYIKRNGKVFGPYYYESYREKGKVKTRFVSGPKKSDNIKSKIKNKGFLLVSLLIVLLVIIGVGFFNSSINSSISGNAIKYVCGVEGCKEVLESDSEVTSEPGGGIEDVGECGEICLIEGELSRLSLNKEDICEEWKDCKTNYNIDEFIKGRIFYDGIQKRNCEFKGRNFIEMKKCIIKEPVILEKEDNKVKVLNLDNVLISELKFVKEKISRLIIDFF
ncbi:MAG: hypothetical protein ABIH37_04575 [archaeon]